MQVTMEPPARQRGVLLTMMAILKKYCHYCKRYTTCGVLWGTMCYRVCGSCMREKMVEVSSLAVRYNLMELRATEQYKKGLICVSHDVRRSGWNINRVLMVDPGALSSHHAREFRLVCLSSFCLAMGEPWLLENMERTRALKVSLVAGVLWGGACGAWLILRRVRRTWLVSRSGACGRDSRGPSGWRIVRSKLPG